MDKRYKTVVIGTGFGGSVMAYQLAKEEGSVCILERGRRYRRSDFASTSREITFWNAGQGLIDFHGSADMDVVMAAGVGGGLLIYANVHLQAEEEVFENWPGGLDLKKLEPYYDRVRYMLKVTPFPGAPEVTKGQVLTDAAKKLGHTVRSPELAIYFGQAGKEVDDPFDRGGPTQTGCNFCGRCVTGCPYHAKNTLDLNYLYLAEHQYGAQIYPIHEALCVKPAEDGPGYTVQFQNHETGETGSVTGDRMVLAAGSIGSTALLLRSKQYLSDLSPTLGNRFSPNGDFLAAAIFTDDPVNPTIGPTITTMVDYRDGPNLIIEEGGFPEMMAWYARSFYPNTGAFRRLLRVFYLRFIRRLWSRQPLNSDKLLRTLFHGSTSPAANMLPFLCIGNDASDGRITLDETGRVVVQWKNRKSMRLWKLMERETKRLAKGMDGIRVLNPAWSLGQKLVTVHPLGGCSMGDSVAEGVTAPNGEIFNYPNLFVADGAIIPKAIGVNPAMTIAAVAEYIASGIINQERES
ncbi:GMC oxidoreductase [Candidatus Poribacteria bacterium]